MMCVLFYYEVYLRVTDDVYYGRTSKICRVSIMCIFEHFVSLFDYVVM